MVAIGTEPRLAMVEDALAAFGVAPGPGGHIDGVAAGGQFVGGSGPVLETVDPTSGQVLARVTTASDADYDCAVSAAEAAYRSWREIPAPRRGEIVRRLGQAFRDRKEDLARLISIENGKILSEARGCSNSGTRSGPSASSPRSISRSRCQAGVGRWRWCAGIRWSGSRRSSRRSSRRRPSTSFTR